MVARLAWGLAAALLCLPAAGGARAQEVMASGAPSLTNYNQRFAVVRETVRMPLRKGKNRLTFAGVTAHLEPDSIVLREGDGKHNLQLLEQSYEANAVSADLLLSQWEGKRLDFLVKDERGRERTVSGKVIRSGYVPTHHSLIRSESDYYGKNTAFGGGGQPVIEVDGKIRFGLPGMPLFPTLGTNVNLRPTLRWSLLSNADAPLEAELAYVSGGMTWEASYSLIVAEDGDEADFTGLVTVDNQSGKDFPNARLQLMAGDISKLARPGAIRNIISVDADNALLGQPESRRPAFTTRAFDEYHLYTLDRPTMLKDRETKQVEFARAEGITTRRVYVYNGAATSGTGYSGYNDEDIRRDRSYGTQSNPKVWVMREIDNTKENRLGFALPAGRARFYRRDRVTQALQFVGENQVDHTPQGETVRIYTGNASDIVGARRQTDYRYQSAQKYVDETFEITLRNHKSTAVMVRTVEQLPRAGNWKIMASSLPWVKKESRTIEFNVPLAAGEEKKLTYTVRYR